MKTPCLEPVRAISRPAEAPRLGVTAACLAARIEDRIGTFVCAQAENLGHLESQLAAEAQKLLRQAAELGAQKKESRAGVMLYLLPTPSTPTGNGQPQGGHVSTIDKLPAHCGAGQRRTSCQSSSAAVMVSRRR